MPDIRIKVAKDKASFVRALKAGDGSTGPFQTYAEVVTFGAAFGFKHNHKVPFSEASRNNPDPIPGDQFRNRIVIDLIALMEDRNPNVLQRNEEFSQENAKLFEQYANGGFELLERELVGVINVSKAILQMVQATTQPVEADDLNLDFL